MLKTTSRLFMVNLYLHQIRLTENTAPELTSEAVLNRANNAQHTPQHYSARDDSDCMAFSISGISGAACSRAASHCSAAIAAAQPCPTDVATCFHSGSWISPAAKTPSTLVRIRLSVM